MLNLSKIGSLFCCLLTLSGRNALSLLLSRPQPTPLFQLDEEDLSSPGRAFDTLLRRTGAYTLLPPYRAALLHLYLSTDITQKELAVLMGYPSSDQVRYHLLKSLALAFEHLPLDLQSHYKSPLDALRETRSGIMTQRHKQKFRQNRWGINIPSDSQLGECFTSRTLPGLPTSIERS